MENQSPKSNDAQSSFSQTDHSVSALVIRLEDADLGGRALWRATIATLWPKKRQRGWTKPASDVTGYPVKSVVRWKWPGCFGVPPAAARRIVALLKAEIDARQQLLLAWSEYLKDASVPDRAAEEFAKHKARKEIFD